MQFSVLSGKTFEKEYHKAFTPLNLKGEAQQASFRDELFTVQGAIEDSLKKKWKQDDDFAVGWDFNYCYHTCGGIYSDRIFCEDYVATIARVLRSVDPAGKWTYHTVCEIIVNPAGRTGAEAIEDRGEFFLRGAVCYIDGSEMGPKWRARLGCKE